MRRRQSGFTLVELVVVLVILGILAAIAIPRYASYVKEARTASLNGLAGAIRSAVVVVQSRWVATGATGASVTMMDGTAVGVGVAGAAAGVPLSTAGGIDNAVDTDNTFVYTPGPATGTYNFPAAIANCTVGYTAATGTVVVTSTGC